MVTTLATHWRTDQGLIIVYGLDDLSRLEPPTVLLTPPPFTPLRRYIICNMFIQMLTGIKAGLVSTLSSFIYDKVAAKKR